ncbi:hypothetical protein PMAYCL1PPCAC_22060, partial [Pristionchus mayeri]
SDCLLDVFFRLDHNDLDEISTLNELMSRLAESPRKFAIKQQALSLEIFQNNSQCIQFMMHNGDEMFTLQMVPTSRLHSMKMKS